MKVQSLPQLFIEELEDIYNSEMQIIDCLPNLIRLASNNELKQTLIDHLGETKEQVDRLEQIFSILDIEPQEVTCEAMEGIIQEANELTENKTKSAILDAAIICAAQKIEHYEIATYGTLKSFAKNLDLEDEIIDLLQETSNEEAAADKKLTKIAEGSFLSSGVNREAANFNAREKGKRR